MSGLHVDKLELVTPGKVLNEIWAGKCDCGEKKDFGYMETTAQRWQEIHKSRYPDHTPRIWGESADDYATPTRRRKMSKKRVIQDIDTVL